MPHEILACYSTRRTAKMNPAKLYTKDRQFDVRCAACGPDDTHPVLMDAWLFFHRQMCVSCGRHVN